MDDTHSTNERTRNAWNANAAYWDQRMGDGNDFMNILVWPATERLLALSPDETILDISCGTGVSTRRLANAGAHVVAFDFSDEMIALAKKYPQPKKGTINYRVIDATDYDALMALGTGQYDGAVCNMAIMDIAEIQPLMNALTRLLKPHGRFVFSVVHPCFNNPSAIHVGEHEDREGKLLTTYSVKISRYMTAYHCQGIAMPGQPESHVYFHRPLSMLLEAGFAEGFVLDGLEEQAFPPDCQTGTFELSWNGRFSEIPPVLVGRMRMASAS